MRRFEYTAYSVHTAVTPADTAYSAAASEKVHKACSAVEAHYTDIVRNIPAGDKAADSAEHCLCPEPFAVAEGDRQIRLADTENIRRNADMCLDMAEGSEVRFAEGKFLSLPEAGGLAFLLP